MAQSDESRVASEQGPERGLCCCGEAAACAGASSPELAVPIAADAIESDAALAK